MFEVREDEPLYALLQAVTADQKNVYGNPINLIEKSGQPKGMSLRINGDEGVGTNPNRYQQHGFHFTADNCIGCHACEAACSEKNNLPPHLSFRSVGYVEGGTYPNFTRMNISMACNHCDDPVCLKGCPTRAYTKHPEYGAVLQDPDICFGCGYCTWVCPYNAPQLDPVEGHVQKCNMCVDRLEAGLKPACVSACVGNALDFGVIEIMPENREQAKTVIPGFPDPNITKPNIRFQQTKTLPLEFTRTDSTPVKYHRGNGTGVYAAAFDEKDGYAGVRRWNLAQLSSRENPLVIFTLITQAVIGAFLILFTGAAAGIPSLEIITASNLLLPVLLTLLVLQGLVLLISTRHLGKPWRFYRGFNNLRHSPLSREALGVSLFFGLLSAVFALSFLNHSFLDWHAVDAVSAYVLGLLPSLTLELITSISALFTAIGAIAGLGGLYYMYRAYRIKARPFWDHWQVAAAFSGNALVLGSIVIGSIGMPLGLAYHGSHFNLPGVLAAIIATGLALELIGHIFHARALQRRGGEAEASYHLMTTRFGKTYYARNALLVISLAGMAALLLIPVHSMVAAAAWSVLAFIIVLTSLVGRALFYVIVIPTTMPGAFFWKNPGFEEHARKTGLARLPQVGVLEYDHYSV